MQPSLSYSPSRVRWYVWCSLFLDLLAFTAILPHFPNVQKECASDAKGTTLSYLLEFIFQHCGISEAHSSYYFVLGGLIGAVLSLGSFLAGPWAGYLADQTFLARRGTLLLVMALSLFAYLGTYLVLTQSTCHFMLFLCLRFLVGVGKSNVSILIAVMDDLAGNNAQARKKGIALIGIAYAIGFVVGPPVSVFAVHALGIHHACWAAGIQGVALLLTFVYVPETRIQDRSKFEQVKQLAEQLPLHNPASTQQNHTSVSTHGNVHTIRPWLIFSAQYNLVPVSIHWIYFLFLAMYSSLEFSLTFSLHTNHDATSRQQAYLYMYIGGIMILIQGGYIRRTQQTSFQLLCQGLISFCMTLGLFSMSTYDPSHSSFLFYLALTCMGFSSATVVSSITTLALQLAQHIPHNTIQQESTIIISALVSARLRSAGHLARICGPLVGAFLYTWKGEVCYLILLTVFCLFLTLYTMFIFSKYIVTVETEIKQTKQK